MGLLLLYSTLWLVVPLTESLLRQYVKQVERKCLYCMGQPEVLMEGHMEPTVFRASTLIIAKTYRKDIVVLVVRLNTLWKSIWLVLLGTIGID